MKFKDKTLEALRVVISGQFNLPKGNYLRFSLFLLFLGFLYITNHLYVESNLREIAELNNEIKELRYESISTSSDLMNMSKQSEVIRRVEAEGLKLKELTEPPRILKVK